MESVSQPSKRTLGIANGKYNIPDNIDACNDEIAEMFEVNEHSGSVNKMSTKVQKNRKPGGMCRKNTLYMVKEECGGQKI